MGAIGGLLGTAGGTNGTGFQPATGANIVNPTNAGQIGDAYSGTQNSLASQQALLQALGQQNGLGNQSQVYGQLQGVANGTGPNPAQAMLNRATGQNVANQAALMAGQRGAGANVGLIARQAGQQGSMAQQDAATQAATLQANQSMGALGQMGQLANTQAANQIGQTNANNAAQMSEQQNLINAQLGVNNANVSSQNSINAANAGLAQTGMTGQQNFIGGFLNGAGPVSSLLGGAGKSGATGGGGMAATAMAQGGMVRMADGGDPSAFSGPRSRFGQFLSTVGQNLAAPQAAAPMQQPQAPLLQQGAANLSQGLVNALKSKPQMSSNSADANFGGYAQGGKVPAMVSPGEIYLNPQAVQQVAQGANPMQVGETIPGKPKVGGAKNSYSNDTVPKDLEAGGVMVPRSDTQSEDPHKASADFVQKVLAKRKARC